MKVPRPLPLNPAQGSTEATLGEPVCLGSPATRRLLNLGASPDQAVRSQVAPATDRRRRA